MMAIYKCILEKLRIFGKISCLCCGKYRTCNVFFILLFVMCSILTPTGADITCGNLTVEYSCHENHVDAKINLIPSSVIETSIRQDKALVWYHLWNERWITLDHSANPTKYDIQSFYVTIHFLNALDVGTYALGCQYYGQTVRSRNDIILDISAWKDLECGAEASTTSEREQTTGNLVNNTAYTPTTATENVKETTGVIFTSTVIWVVALCSVIIVLVFAGTVIFVIRKKGLTHTALSHLASHDGDSTANLHRDTEASMSSGTRGSNIYNEIETDISKRGTQGVNSSKLSLLSMQQSPALPKRPSNAKPLKCDSDKQYDMIRNETIRSEDNSSIPESCKNCKLADDDYATIHYTEKQLKDAQNIKVPHNDYMPEYSQVIKDPVYAKVQKDAVDDYFKHTVNKQSANTYGNDYNVKFPAINYANIVTQLGNNEIATLDEPVKYCNLAAKRRSERLASSKSLKYAVLDHTGCDAYMKEQNCGPYDLPEFVKLVTCQYATIDFNKKAFVAPIRKAPSSWYKRKQQKKKI